MRPSLPCRRRELSVSGLGLGGCSGRAAQAPHSTRLWRFLRVRGCEVTQWASCSFSVEAEPQEEAGAQVWGAPTVRVCLRVPACACHQLAAHSTFCPSVPFLPARPGAPWEGRKELCQPGPRLPEQRGGGRLPARPAHLPSVSSKFTLCRRNEG